ncbi:MAG TPA: hypothetical protein ENJ50_01715, partial [Planctomycetaceae bacterium]|nr:hypothetical protein [Planctomycetaceae bacterium]
MELLFEGRPTRVLTNAYDAKLGATLIDVPLAHGGMKIRAPGHVEKALVDDLQSIQLKPVALLELDGQQLRASVTSVVIPDDFGEQGQREFADYATWGFVDANRFALAVDVSPYMVAGGDDPALSFSLNLGSHQRLSVAWSLREGRRSALTLPRMADIGLLAPLSVELTTQENRAGAVFQLEAWRMLQPRALPVGEWTFADGKVQLRSRNLISNIKVDGNRAEIPELILGEQYRIAAYDDRGGSGGLEIQHSGNPISIETLSGLILTGTLKSASRPLPGMIRAQWKLADEYDYSEEEPLRLSGKRPRWLGGEKTVEVGADGSIQVVVVRKGFGGQPPTRRSPPASVTLFLSSPGFKRLELDVIPEGEFEVELGPLTLSAQQPNLILDSHPFLEASDIAWSPVATSATSEPGYFEAETSIRLANGSFEVFLTPADADGLQNEYSFKSSLHGRIAESFPNPAPQAIVLFGKLAVSREYVSVGFELFGNSIIPHYRS